jgi:N-acetylneuraminate synthase
MSVSINDRNIGVNFHPYVVAELSANHNGSIERAFNLIKAAKDSGADAVKIQTFTPDSITLKSTRADFMITDGLWSGRSLWDLYRDAALPLEWHKDLFAYAKEIDITIFSSPFDNAMVDFLLDLNVPAFKIASCEVVDLPFVDYIASTGKPIIISSGMANMHEIQIALDTIRKHHDKIILLHCVSGYPTPTDQINVKLMARWSKQFNVEVGLSDHSLSNNAALSSVALGGCLVEKHFTLSRGDGGIDDSFSIEPHELKKLRHDMFEVWSSLGDGNDVIAEAESGNLKYRRSLYYVSDLKKGQVITKDNIRSIRPGYGLAPNTLPNLLGKVLVRDVDFATPVQFNDFQKD